MKIILYCTNRNTPPYTGAGDDLCNFTGKEIDEFLREYEANRITIIMIESTTIKNGKTSEETRYYISSLPPDAKKISTSIRSHWAVENSLHWVLDMSFNDDLSRIRRENAPQNMAVIRHFALNMIRQVQQKRQSIKALRKKAGWDNNLLAQIINFKNL